MIIQASKCDERRKNVCFFFGPTTAFMGKVVPLFVDVMISCVCTLLIFYIFRDYPFLANASSPLLSPITRDQP